MYLSTPLQLYTISKPSQLAISSFLGLSPIKRSCSGCAGLAGLQAAIFRPDLVRGVQLMNISLRLLHLKKQPAWKKPVVKALQTALHSSFVGPLFFSLLAKPQVSPCTQAAVSSAAGYITRTVGTSYL